MYLRERQQKGRSRPSTINTTSYRQQPLWAQLSPKQNLKSWYAYRIGCFRFEEFSAGQL